MTKKSNVIIFSDPRSGSSALHNLIVSKNECYSKHESNEYFDTTAYFFPVLNDVIQWNDTTDQMYANKDYSGLNNYYSQHAVDDSAFVLKPILENGFIKMKGTPFNIEHAGGFVDGAFDNEYNRRLELLAMAKPYCFKYFDYHQADDNWIDRDNTTVIVLIRNNILDQLASIKRQSFTNNWHKFKDSDHKEFNKNDIVEKVTAEEVQYAINLMEKQHQRIKKINPDIIVTYEWLNSNNIFDKSIYQKINTIPTRSFFGNYQQAKKMISAVPAVYNQNLENLFPLIDIK